MQALYGGYGQVADQLMPPIMWGRSSKVKGYPYNPKRAKQLLVEAGHPDGFALDFWYMPISRTYFPNGKVIATAIASDLSKIGIHVSLKTEDWAAYLKDRSTNKFPIFMYGGTGDYGDPDDWFGFHFAKYDPKSVVFSYNNPQVFSLIAKARSITNQTERAKMYAQIAEIVSRDVWDVYIAHARVPILMQKNVEGLVLQPDANEHMETVELK